MTIADKIRGMSDEELAQFLVRYAMKQAIETMCACAVSPDEMCVSKEVEEIIKENLDASSVKMDISNTLQWLKRNA